MSKHKDKTKESISIAITGSGGAGVMTAGNLLLEVAAQAGWYGLMVRSSGPQIRGGEAAALLRFSQAPVECLDDRFDVLIGIDWQNIHRFADEIPLDAASVMLGDPEQGEPPEVFVQRGARYAPLPFKQMAKAIPGSWPNMIALGLAAGLVGLPLDSVKAVLQKSLKKGGGEKMAANLAAADAGYAAAAAVPGGAAPCTERQQEVPRCALADHRQPGRRLRRCARRRALLRRLSDHAGDRSARMAGARAAQSRRRSGAGRGRTGFDQHDHRRLLRRRAFADGHLRTGPVADDRGDRAGGRGRSADRGHRRDARRSVDRHSGEKRAKRRQHRAQRLARRCAAYRRRAELHRRLRRGDAVGGVPGRGDAVPGDRALRPVLRPDARGGRPARRYRPRRASA